MARLLRLLTALVGLALLGHTGIALAAPDCFQISEKIKRMPVKEGLLEIRNATRQHLRAFKRKGASYEGQYDIACLIGQYMTLTDGNSSTISGDEAFRRYENVESWFVKRFKEDLAGYAKAIATYKNNPDLVEQEREEGYANSEFVLWSLVGSVNNAYQTMPEVSWDTSKLLDEVWCGEATRAKTGLDQHLRSLPEEASKTNWTALSESEFEHARSKFRPAPEGLDAMCGGADLIISSRDIAGLKSRYKKVAKAEVKKSWISSLEKDAQLNKKNWNEIAWLGLSCTKAPTKQQYALFETLRWYDDNSINGKWWADAAQRKRAEFLFDGQLERSLQRAGDACTELIRREIDQFGKTAKKWQSQYRRTVQKSLTSVWLDEPKAQTLARKLSEFESHVTLITGAPKVCASPSKSDRAAIQKLKAFIDTSAGGTSAFQKPTTVELFLDAKQSSLVVERTASQCKDIPQIQSFVAEFKQSSKKYESWARKQSADVWAYATKGQFKSDLENLIRRIYPDALPSDEEKRAVAFLYDPKERIDPRSQQVLIGLSNRLSLLAGDANIYHQILDKRREFAESREDRILSNWVDVLSSKNCKVAESSIQPFASLTRQCTSLDQEDAQVLANYCRLKRLAQSISKSGEREGNHGGSGGDSGSGAEGGDAEGGDAEGGDSGGGGSSMFFPQKPFWDQASAIQVALLGSWSGEASFSELILENPISAAVADAGFLDARGLHTALVQISKNGDLEDLLNSKLRGCNAGRRYKKEIGELKDLRDFYIGAYETLCRDDELSNRSRYCDVAALLHRGQKKTDSGIGEGQGSEKGPENKKKITVIWRSNIDKDWISVSWRGREKRGRTGPNFKTAIPEGAVVQVEWWPEHQQREKSVSFQFKCCQQEHIEKRSKEKVLVEQNTQGSVTSIWFDSENATSVPPANYDRSCKIYYPSMWGGVVQTLQERPVFLSREVKLDVWPKRKIRLSTIKQDIQLGARIPRTSLFLSAVGTDFFVLFPTDKVDNVAIKDWFSGNDRPTRNFVITLKAMDVGCKIHQ